MNEKEGGSGPWKSTVMGLSQGGVIKDYVL